MAEKEDVTLMTRINENLLELCRGMVNVRQAVDAMRKPELSGIMDPEADEIMAENTPYTRNSQFFQSVIRKALKPYQLYQILQLSGNEHIIKMLKIPPPESHLPDLLNAPNPLRDKKTDLEALQIFTTTCTNLFVSQIQNASRQDLNCKWSDVSLLVQRGLQSSLLLSNTTKNSFKSLSESYGCVWEFLQKKVIQPIEKYINENPFPQVDNFESFSSDLIKSNFSIKPDSPEEDRRNQKLIHDKAIQLVEKWMEKRKKGLQKQQEIIECLLAESKIYYEVEMRKSAVENVDVLTLEKCHNSIQGATIRYFVGKFSPQMKDWIKKYVKELKMSMLSIRHQLHSEALKTEKGGSGKVQKDMKKLSVDSVKFEKVSQKLVKDPLTSRSSFQLPLDSLKKPLPQLAVVFQMGFEKTLLGCIRPDGTEIEVLAIVENCLYFNGPRLVALNNNESSTFGTPFSLYCLVNCPLDILHEVEIGGSIKNFRLEELMSFILCTLKMEFEFTLQVSFTSETVIVVPQSLSLQGRDCVKLAGELAGFSNVQIVSDTNALALSFSISRGKGKKNLDLVTANSFENVVDVASFHVDDRGILHHLAFNGSNSFQGGWASTLKLNNNDKITIVMACSEEQAQEFEAAAAIGLVVKEFVVVNQEFALIGAAYLNTGIKNSVDESYSEILAPPEDAKEFCSYFVGQPLSSIELDRVKGNYFLKDKLELHRERMNYLLLVQNVSNKLKQLQPKKAIQISQQMERHYANVLENINDIQKLLENQRAVYNIYIDM